MTMYNHHYFMSLYLNYCFSNFLFVEAEHANLRRKIRNTGKIPGNHAAEKSCRFIQRDLPVQELWCTRIYKGYISPLIPGTSGHNVWGQHHLTHSRFDSVNISQRINHIRLSEVLKMNQWKIPGFFVILIIAMTLLSGCADEPAPAPAPTPVPTTVPPTTTVAPTPTLTAACQDLLASADADVAFMNSLKENIRVFPCPVTRLYQLQPDGGFQYQPDHCRRPEAKDPRPCPGPAEPAVGSQLLF